MKITTFGPFTARTDLNQQEEALSRVHGIIFISDAQKNDWYCLQKKFSESSLKIVFDETGLINCASYDASTLWPQYFYVAEVLDLPEGFCLPVPGGKWIFDGKIITEKVMTEAEETAEIERVRAVKIAEATIKIAPLQDAVELGRASEEDRARLIAWKNHRVDLNQLDISQPGKIVWPEPPVNVA